MRNYEYWRLVFIDRNAVKHTIYGIEEVMRGAFEAWKAAREATDGIGPKLMEIDGHTETPDRADVVMLVVVEDIVGASLVRMT